MNLLSPTSPHTAKGRRHSSSCSAIQSSSHSHLEQSLSPQQQTLCGLISPTSLRQFDFSPRQSRSVSMVMCTIVEALPVASCERVGEERRATHTRERRVARCLSPCAYVSVCAVIKSGVSVWSAAHAAQQSVNTDSTRPDLITRKHINCNYAQSHLHSTNSSDSSCPNSVFCRNRS